MDIQSLQNTIQYHFKNSSLLVKSLVHKSYLSDKDKKIEISESNERLEFLGDAVLEMVVTEYLYNNYSENEGFLTSLRASLVNYRTIGDVGVEIGLEEIIYLSSGEKLELGKARHTIVADAVEALIGAIYLDGGYQNSADFIKTFILPKLNLIIENELYKDPKTQIQEMIQKLNHVTPKYQMLKSEGKDHDKTFVVGLMIGDTLIAEGSGKSKQDAETMAAKKAIQELKRNN